MVEVFVEVILGELVVEVEDVIEFLGVKVVGFGEVV